MTDVHVVLRRCVAAVGLAGALSLSANAALAQAVPPAASAPAQAVFRQRGTVKGMAGSTLTLTTDDGHEMAVTVAPNAKIMQLAPGSTDLKAAQPIALGDVAVGDRVLVVGAAGADGSSFQAGRVILMKSTDIAAQHAREEADWQRHGSGGMVTAVDASSATLSMSARGRVVAVKTTPSTIFRRYAGDSVKFEDAKRGTLEQIQPGDQMRVRGTRSEDGATLAADEIVSGRFENLSGTLTAVDASAGTVTLRDLATKKPVTVSLTAKSAIHRLPPEAAAAMAAGARPGASGFGQTATSAAAQHGSDGATAPASAPARDGAHRPGGDLSQVVAACRGSRFPTSMWGMPCCLWPRRPLRGARR